MILAVTLTVTLGLLTLSMVVVLVRAFAGPTVQDRILSASTFSTTTVLWLCVWAFVGGCDHVIDIATIYALMGFVATIALLRFVESAPAGEDEAPARDDR